MAKGDYEKAKKEDREARERARRLQKMRKHLSALESLVSTEKERNILDEIIEGISILDGSHPSIPEARPE